MILCTQYTHSEWKDPSSNWHLCLNTPPFQDRPELQDNSQDYSSRPTASHREVTEDVNSRSSSTPRLLDSALQQVNMQKHSFSLSGIIVLPIYIPPCIWVTFISCLIKVYKFFLNCAFSYPTRYIIIGVCDMTILDREGLERVDDLPKWGDRLGHIL